MCRGKREEREGAAVRTPQVRRHGDILPAVCLPEALEPLSPASVLLPEWSVTPAPPPGESGSLVAERKRTELIVHSYVVRYSFVLRPFRPIRYSFALRVP